jgi:hypothetical protein
MEALWRLAKETERGRAEAGGAPSEGTDT